MRKKNLTTLLSSDHAGLEERPTIVGNQNLQPETRFGWGPGPNAPAATAVAAVKREWGASEGVEEGCWVLYNSYLMSNTEHVEVVRNLLGCQVFMFSWFLVSDQKYAQP